MNEKTPTERTERHQKNTSEEEQKKSERKRSEYSKENYKLFKEKLRLNNVVVSEIMYTPHYSYGICYFLCAAYCNW